MPQFLAWNLLIASDGLDCSGLLKDIANTVNCKLPSSPLSCMIPSTWMFDSDGLPIDSTPVENEPIPNPVSVPAIVSWKTKLDDIRVKPYFALPRQDKLSLPLIEHLYQLLDICRHKTAFPESPMDLYGPKTRLKIPMLVSTKITIAIVARTSAEHDFIIAFLLTVKSSHDKTTRLNTVLDEFLTDDEPPSLELWQRLSDKLWWKDNYAFIGDLLRSGHVIICRTQDLMVIRKPGEKPRKFIPRVVPWASKKKSLRNKR